MRETAAGLLTPEERALVADADAAIDQALQLWDRLSRRSELMAALRGADVFAEVPFSLRETDGGREVIIRGTIDLLAVGEDGTLTVVEVKTGSPRAEHQRQLDLYVRAVRSMFRQRQVEGLLIHA
jgi:ATP-dependent exoDNAse (exonuclease V) beta subunit